MENSYKCKHAVVCFKMPTTRTSSMVLLWWLKNSRKPQNICKVFAGGLAHVCSSMMFVAIIARCFRTFLLSKSCLATCMHVWHTTPLCCTFRRYSTPLSNVHELLTLSTSAVSKYKLSAHSARGAGCCPKMACGKHNDTTFGISVFTLYLLKEQVKFH